MRRKKWEDEKDKFEMKRKRTGRGKRIHIWVIHYKRMEGKRRMQEIE